MSGIQIFLTVLATVGGLISIVWAFDVWIIPKLRKQDPVLDAVRGELKSELEPLHRRFDRIEDLIEKFEELALDHNKIISAQIYSAIALNSEQTEAIQNRLEDKTGKKVQLEEITDDSLMGGFIVKIRDSVIDYSLKRQMQRLKDKMIFG